MKVILVILFSALSITLKGQEYGGCNTFINKYDKKQKINPNEDLVRLHPDSLKKIDFFGDLEWINERELNSTGLKVEIFDYPDSLDIQITNKKKTSLYLLNCYELIPKEIAGKNPYLMLGYYPGSDLSIHIPLNELKSNESFTYNIPLSNWSIDSLWISVYLVPDLSLIKSSIIHVDKDEYLEYANQNGTTLINSHTSRYNYYESIEVLNKTISIGRKK